MPPPCLYELFCLAKPRLSKAGLTEIIRAASRSVLDNGGILTDIKSFGERPLAYDIRKPGGKFSEVRCCLAAGTLVLPARCNDDGMPAGASPCRQQCGSLLSRPTPRCWQTLSTLLGWMSAC